MKLSDKSIHPDRIPSTLDIIASTFHYLLKNGASIEVLCSEDEEWPYVIAPHKLLAEAVDTGVDMSWKYMVRRLPVSYSVSDAPVFRTEDELLHFLTGAAFILNNGDIQIPQH